MKLTQVTRNNLRDVAGPLWALWATAQQINAHQKVELSIRCVFSAINMHWNFDTQVRFVSEGLKSKFDPYYLKFITLLTVIPEYWRDLGESVFFQEHQLVDCIARIHDDVVKIWNFNDPSKVSVNRHPGKRTLTFVIQVLSGEDFFKWMIELVEPLSDGVIRNELWVALQKRIDVT